MTRRSLIALAAGTAAVAAVAVALAARPGNDPGGRAAPACTVTVPAGGDPGRALRRARPGAVVCLASGATFVRDLTVTASGVPGRPVVLTSAPGSAAVLRGRLLVPARVRDVEIRGLVLDGRNARGLPSPSVSGVRIALIGNVITNHRTGICLTLGSTQGFGTARAVTVRGNLIHRCGRLPATNLEHGVYVESSRGARIVDNVIRDNADRGIQLYPDARDTLVEGNLIDGNGVGVIFSGDTSTASSGNVVRGNVIVNSRDRHDVEAFWAEGGPVGAGNVVSGNCVGGGRLGAFGPRVGFTTSGNRLAGAGAPYAGCPVGPPRLEGAAA